MDKKKKGLDDLGPGFEVIDGGIKTTGLIRGGGCICSPGGKFAGSVDPCGCACGCFGTSTPVENNGANDKLST